MHIHSRSVALHVEQCVCTLGCSRYRHTGHDDEEEEGIHLERHEKWKTWWQRMVSIGVEGRRGGEGRGEE